MGDKCPKCGENMKYSKFKDIIKFECFYFSVFIVACPNCGHLDNELSYIEE